MPGEQTSHYKDEGAHFYVITFLTCPTPPSKIQCGMHGVDLPTLSH